MKSKQKLIEKWESAIETAEFYGKGKEDRLIEYMREFVSDLSQLDEPEVLSQELPVIPKYVANWIEEEQGTMSNWKQPSRFISDSKYKKDQRRYKWSQVEGNMDKFMSALINGYQIEEEPKYNVRVPYTETTYYFRSDEELRTSRWVGSGMKEKEEFIFTEQQIKELFPDIPKKYWEEIK